MNLVTGASGILGSHIVLELIKKGQPVMACRQKSSSVEAIQNLFRLHFNNWEEEYARIRWKELDILDIYSIEEALEGIETVYHCAGLVSFSNRNRKKLFDVNEGGTRNLVNALLARGNISLCHVSSIASINNSDQTGALTEATFWKRSGRENNYVLSKYNAEREVWRGMEEGLRAVIVNPGVILAPPFWNHSSSLLLLSAQKARPFYTPGVTGYITAEDAAQIMIRLTQERHFENRYILIENNYSYKQIFSAMRRGYGYRSGMLELPYFVLKSFALLENLWSAMSGKEAVLSKAALRAAFTVQMYSNEKIKTLLNFKFTPVEDYLVRICENESKRRIDENKVQK